MLRLLPVLLFLTACTGVGPAERREEGQDFFLSAAPNGLSPNGSGGDIRLNADESATGAPEKGDAASTSTTPRAIEETDLYRVDGDRLYYLNAYRGLMVFDITNIDAPTLLGRAPIFGSPVEMIVRNGLAHVVVADWYGQTEDGAPFRGSVVRTFDATDPAHITIKGEAKLAGFTRDVRIVGDVLYAVSEDYGWSYGWYAGGGVAVDVAVGGGSGSGKVIVSSVNIASAATAQGTLSYEGYAGVFNVSTNAILLARNVATNATKTELIYIDISDPAGAIHERSKLQVNGRVQGFGADNGRFNLDFFQDRYARLLGCAAEYCGGNNAGYVLQTVDFGDPAAPMLVSTFDVDATGWSLAARFDGTRLYLSPSDGDYDAMNDGTPVKVFDLSNPLLPVLKGEALIDGNVWLFMPAGDKLLALGSSFDGVDYGQAVTVHYLDVKAAPVVLGTAAFGDGWTWTPAAGTFKAFTLDTQNGLVVLPFSGWSYEAQTYNNGVQLVEISATTIATRGAAKTQGWVSRGVLAKGRILALSDTALSVIDYTNRAAPSVVKEVVLARNVVDTVPLSDRVALLSTEWYGNDVANSELRVVPKDDVEETRSLDALATVTIDGTNARVFANGDMVYVLSNVRKEVACDVTRKGPTDPNMPVPKCYSWTQRATAIDLSAATPVKRGSIDLPDYGSSSFYWGFYGCFAYDWYGGDDAVQAAPDAIAIRRWLPVYGNDGYDVAKHSLFVISFADPDAPTLGSAQIATQTDAWWGNLRVIGDTLYASDWEWYTTRTINGAQRWYVRYFINKIDLRDRSRPKVSARINVPGILVGGSGDLLYTMDYRWTDRGAQNELAVVRVGDKAKLVGTKTLDGATGSVFVRGEHAYMSAQDYGYETRAPSVRLLDVNLADPKAITVTESGTQQGWGWLLAVEGDRALLTSGWGQAVDLYRLSGEAPAFEETVRTRGWWSSSVHREDDSLYLSSGYWGAQRITLQ